MAQRGRFAPSPSGDMHLGNASTSLAAWLSVRAAGGRIVLRMEDLDRPRVRPGSAEGILRDLEWLGLDWDEGPDRGGPHEPYEQSRRGPLYDAAFSRLRADGRVYPCFCSRRDIAAAARAPQEQGDEQRYPGTCRSLEPAQAEDRIGRGDRHAWRFRVGEHTAPAYRDLVLGPLGGPGTPPPGDFVVRRHDGSAAYQLAVVVDDAAMAVDEVVRGDDLVTSTYRQVLLFHVLGLPLPSFGHVPLILGSDGVRLSKRHAGTSVRELREAGWEPARVVGLIASLLGLRPTSAPVAPEDLADGFSLAAIRRSPEGIRLSDLPGKATSS